MSTLAVAVMPIIDLEGWRRFAEDIDTGDRAEAHREFLRQSHVTAEHAFHQETPEGDMMMLVWEGIDQAAMNERFAGLRNAATDHERYLRDVVLPQLHGVDMTQMTPPVVEELMTLSA